MSELVLSTSHNTPLGGSSKKGSHVYFLLIVAIVLTTIVTSACTIVTSGHLTIVASEQHLYQTIVQFDKTIVFPRKLASGSIHAYFFATAP